MKMMMMSQMFGGNTTGSNGMNGMNPMMFMMMSNGSNMFENMFDGAFDFGFNTEAEEEDEDKHRDGNNRENRRYEFEVTTLDIHQRNHHKDADTKTKSMSYRRTPIVSRPIAEGRGCGIHLHYADDAQQKKNDPYHFVAFEQFVQFLKRCQLEYLSLLLLR